MGLLSYTCPTVAGIIRKATVKKKTYDLDEEDAVGRTNREFSAASRKSKVTYCHWLGMKANGKFGVRRIESVRICHCDFDAFTQSKCACVQRPSDNYAFHSFFLQRLERADIIQRGDAA